MVRQFGILSVSAFALVAFGCSGCGGHPVTDIDMGHIVLPDGAADAPRDVGTGADRPDMGPATDGGGCFVGLPCDPVRGCNGGQQCQGPLGGTAANAITISNCTGGVGVDAGAAGVLMSPIYVGGECTNAVVSSMQAREGSPGACNPRAASDTPAMAGMDGCLACAKCTILPFRKTLPTDPNIVQCAPRCTPSATTSGGCRAPGLGYECDTFSNTCQPFGCQTDLECQLYTEDSNGDMMFDTATGDRYCQDGTSATCNLTTGRCEHPAHTGARAGSTCLRDSDCEANGRCLTELRQNFPGGYCTNFGCNVTGMECGDAADKCQDLGGNSFLCLQPCTVNAESAALSMGVGGHGDTCRAGYQCVYDDHSPVAMTNNGGCWLGNYNAVTTNNVGHTCVDGDDTTCYSPHGSGRCIFSGINASCSILGCAGYPTSANVCGTGNNCFVFTDSSSACLHTCTTPADCAAVGGPSTDGCIQLTTADTNKYCWPNCAVDADCQTGHTCVGASMTTAGTCTP